jgi:hypothetical protein
MTNGYIIFISLPTILQHFVLFKDKPSFECKWLKQLARTWQPSGLGKQEKKQAKLIMMMFAYCSTF